MTRRIPLAILLASLLAAPATAITLDGMNIPSEGLTLRVTQDTATGFGDSTGTQASTGGSELNQLFADISGNLLEMGVTGNIEGNFNKMWFFFDAVDGGENVLSGDNIDGGFNEIQNFAGMTFPAGVTMDHGIRVEVGGGFYGIRFFDLITNTANDIATGGGAGDLPLSNAGGPKGVSLGWDNSNAVGVTGAAADDAATATTGFEFSIDMVQAFNGSQGDVKVMAFVSNGGGDFLANQMLPGLAGAANPGTPSSFVVPGVVTIPGSPIEGSLLGDVDGDGDVDLFEDPQNGDGVSDFDIIRMNWLETNDTFGQILARGDGDLNENGEVGIEDFREWKNAFPGSSAQIAQAFALLSGSAAPEPSAAMLALVLAVASVARRRQQ